MSSRNPYMAPDAPTVTASHGAVRERGSRPISVWVVQLLLVCAFGIVTVAIWKFGWVIALYGGQQTPMSQMALFLMTRIAVIATVGGLIVAIHRGLRAGLWGGLAAMAIFLVMVYTSPDVTQYANDSERAGGAIWRYFFMPLLVAWWVYAFAFSAKARRYFAPLHAMS